MGVSGTDQEHATESVSLEQEELAEMDVEVHPAIREQALLRSAGPRTHVWRLMRHGPPPLALDERRRPGELLRHFQRHQVLAVADADGHFCGVVTRAEVLALGARLHGGAVPVQGLLRKATALTEEVTVEEAAPAFARERLSALPVVNRQGQVVGMVDDDAVLAVLIGRGRVRAATSVPVVDEVMTRSPLITSPEVALEEAAAVMARAGVRHLPVVDDEGRLVGMLSDRDLRTRLGGNPQEWFHSAVASLSETVREVMSVEPVALPAGTWLEAALEIFADEGIGAIPIIDEDERVVGIVSYVDVLSWLGRAGARASTPAEFAH